MATLSSATARSDRSSWSEVREIASEDPRWAEFVAGRPEALAYHDPRWTQVLVDSYGYRPFVLAAVDAGGDIVGGLPVVDVRTLRKRRWIALPFSDECPPLLAPDVSDTAFGAALEEVQRSSGVSSLEIRAKVAARGAEHRVDAVVHTTELGADPKELFRSFHKSQVQRNVRRAERENLVVRLGDQERDMTRIFYGLHAQTRRRLGTPVQPRRFFAALWRHVFEPGHGRLLIVYSGNRPIAAAVFLAGNDTLTYKFGASDAAYWGLRPNHVLFWTAIQWASEAGFRRLDFGRSDLEDQGLRDFKAGWAAKEEPLVYTTLGLTSPSAAPRPAGASRAVLRRAPVWVCRAAGELLYRYAA